jgi:hypothetical protein
MKATAKLKLLASCERLPSPTRLSTAETVDEAMASAPAICAAVIRRRRSRSRSCRLMPA